MPYLLLFLQLLVPPSLSCQIPVVQTVLCCAPGRANLLSASRQPGLGLPAFDSESFPPLAPFAMLPTYPEQVSVPLAVPSHCFDAGSSQSTNEQQQADSLWRSRPTENRQALQPQPTPLSASAPVEAPKARASAPAPGSSAPRTTVMLRNLPSGFTRRMLLEFLDAQGFAGRYDFAYLPFSFETMTSLTHAFVNMVGPADADRLRDHLEGFSSWGTPSDSVCSVVWNDKSQGLSELVERYRNSPVMHDGIPEECKPVIFRNGKKVKFPAPTQKIKAPKGCKSRM